MQIQLPYPLTDCFQMNDQIILEVKFLFNPSFLVLKHNSDFYCLCFAAIISPKSSILAIEFQDKELSFIFDYKDDRNSKEKSTRHQTVK